MSKLRIVAWNCNWKLHAKFPALAGLKPDIAIVRECAGEQTLRSAAPLFYPEAGVWAGDENRGIGVFGYGGYEVELDPCYDRSLMHIAPVRVSGPSEFHLLAVHAIHSREPGEKSLGIVGPLLRALDVYADFCAAKPLVVAGDLNNHVRWDKAGKLNNHANLVARLDECGSVSAYHEFGGVAQGSENEPTFYHRKSLEKPYHIDYCFVPKSWAITDCAVGTAGEWLHLSDHMPLVVDAVISS